MANKIYLPLDAKIKEDFGALSKSVFGSEFKNLNFDDPEPAASEINQWVSNNKSQIFYIILFLTQKNWRCRDLLLTPARAPAFFGIDF